jgi:hypothetical protein
MDNKILDAKMLQKCANTLDDDLNEIYQKWRIARQIGLLEL